MAKFIDVESVEAGAGPALSEETTVVWVNIDLITSVWPRARGKTAGLASGAEIRFGGGDGERIFTPEPYGKLMDRIRAASKPRL